MADNCIHCGKSVVRVTNTVLTFGLVHAESRREWCGDGKHLACLPQMAVE